MAFFKSGEPRMNILYFCVPPLLDYSIEQINDLKKHVDLHVVIGVSLHSPNHTIFKLKDTHLEKDLYAFDEIKEHIENPELFESYLSGCKSVHLVFFSPKFGMNILFTNFKLVRLLNQIKPQLIHFDDISGRLSVFTLMLRNKKIVLNVHDPAPHSGEETWSSSLIRKLVYRKIKVFCTFSDFSKSLFYQIYQPRVPVVGLRLVPYHSYNLFRNKKIEEISKSSEEKLLLFFGRISRYKGIDELLTSFSHISKQFPNLKLLIAGRGNYAYQVPDELKGSPSLIILNRFICEDEIKSLFEISDVLICPYRDATQSGVLMTARVFNLPVIASNVGALPEYIQDGKDGIIYDLNDENGLEKSILKYLNGYHQLRLDSLLIDNKDLSENTQKLLIIYKKIIDNKL
jgi:glycosyltransferase involved in cell wall biosynthesis